MWLFLCTAMTVSLTCVTFNVSYLLTLSRESGYIAYLYLISIGINPLVTIRLIVSQNVKAVNDNNDRLKPGSESTLGLIHANITQ